MLKLRLIRHGKTLGNTYKRYIGKTDENLLEEGLKLFEFITPPEVDIVISSPLKRCVQTASLLFPNKEIIIRENFKECDFGDFENKNYKELCGNADYQKWIDSNAKLPFPNGESIKEFKNRTLKEFEFTVKELINKNITSGAIVTHGGTIMSIMETLSPDKKPYYEWSTDNLEGYEFFVDDKMHLTGIEPTPLAPEAKALSIELQMLTTD